jgi:hypothetical protein
LQSRKLKTRTCLFASPFDVDQSQSDSQRFDQSGNISDNEGGVSTSGTFSLDETDTEGETPRPFEGKNGSELFN